MPAADLQSEGVLGTARAAPSSPSPARASNKYADDALSVASTASFADHGWAATAPGRTAASAFARADAFTSGAAAVLHVAGHLSDTVFRYPLLGADAPPASDEPARARVVPLEIRAGAGAAVQGAQAAGAHVSALLPSQPLPLFVPALYAMAASGRPAVVHLSCESLRRADLAIGGSFEALDALSHAGNGAMLLASGSAQECHDLAVVAHVAATRLRKLAVHFFDGARVAREHSKLSLLTAAALRRVDDAALSSAADALASSVNVAEQVQSVMDDLFPVLRRQYNVYEYVGAADATRVIVVVGDASDAIKQAVGYEQMLGEKVGVLQVRLLLPWSHALFARALPATVTSVAVLENISREAFDMQRGNVLTRSVQVFFQSPYWAGSANPEVVTGIYGGAFRNVAFTAGMARAVLHRLHASNAVGFRRRRAFVVAKSEAKYDAALDAVASSVGTVRAPLDVVFGEAFEISLGSGAAAYSKQFVVWGFDDDEQRAGAGTDALFSTTLDLLAKNPATQVHALVTHSTSAASGSAGRPVSALQVRVGPTAHGSSGGVSGPFEPIEQADVVVVTRAELLQSYDVVASVKAGGSLLVLASWKTADDIDESSEFKLAVAARGVQLLTVDAVELATRVEDDSVAAVGPLVAFFKAARLLDERVVLALLAARFPAEQQSTLRSFVSAVWGDTNPITYPAEDWRVPVVQEAEAESVAALPSLSDVRPAVLSFANAASAAASKKRALRQASVSIETRTAWQLTFPEAFGASTRVRDHVTDLVTVTKWQRLTPEDYSRNVFHIEMDTTNTRIKYKIGEALAVFAHNDEKDVLAFLRSYNVDPEALVTLPASGKTKAKGKAKGKKADAEDATPVGETLTYFQLFSQVLDIFGRPSKKFYEALAARATDAKEQEALTALLSPEGKDEYKRRVDETVTFAELLDEFPSARPSMGDLVALVPRIKARHYSIASSMKMNPTSVHLLIVVHDWTTPSGKYRVGQATRFLSSVRVGQQLSVSVCSSVMKLPTNHADPIIMAGLGTGMAPFRAFIQERAFLRARGVQVGPIALYFGSRSKKQEYLYGDELDAYARDGLVTLLRCAFSRDQPHKVYIQDKIAEDKETLADWMLHRNGHFYLCGPTWPVADVRAALLGAFEQVGALDARQAGQALERMRDQGRYVLEVY